MYVSGQLYFVPETGKLLEGTIGEMTEQCMKNIAAILAEADCTLADIVKTTIFLKDLNDFAADIVRLSGFDGAAVEDCE